MAPRRDTLYRPRTGGSCRRAPVACGHHIRRKRAYATAFVSAGVKVRNVAGLSYTTSSALIFSSRRRFWASNSAIAALVDTGSLVYLIAALWCRSKDAAGEPQQGLVGKLAARVTTRRVTCPKRVVEGSPAASSKLALTALGRVGAVHPRVGAGPRRVARRSDPHDPPFSRRLAYPVTRSARPGHSHLAAYLHRHP